MPKLPHHVAPLQQPRKNDADSQHTERRCDTGISKTLARDLCPHIRHNGKNASPSDQCSNLGRSSWTCPEELSSLGSRKHSWEKRTHARCSSAASGCLEDTGCLPCPGIKWLTLAVAPLLLALSSARVSAQDSLYCRDGAGILFLRWSTVSIHDPRHQLRESRSLYRRAGFREHSALGPQTSAISQASRLSLAYHSDGVRRSKRVFSDYGAWHFLNTGALDQLD
jgi:hypothetical protein